VIDLCWNQHAPIPARANNGETAMTNSTIRVFKKPAGSDYYTVEIRVPEDKAERVFEIVTQVRAQAKGEIKFLGVYPEEIW
jgi:hypothetical protein